MHDRIQRYIIPATVVIMTAFLTILIGVKIKEGTTLMQDFINLGNAGIVTAVITIAVINLGLGYVCHAIFCAWMFFSKKERFINTSRLMVALGVDASHEPRLTRSQWDALIGEFHRRLHTNASESLREYCTRRNSAWYITKTCVVAIAMGFTAALLFASMRDDLLINWPSLSYIVIALIIFSVASWKVGTQWNKEFWEVVWNWLALDLTEHKLTNEWLKANNLLDIYNKRGEGKGATS